MKKVRGGGRLFEGGGGGGAGLFSILAERVDAYSGEGAY